MRTKEEILERIRERRECDIFGFELTEYLSALSKEDAEVLKGEVLKPDADLSGWEQTLKTGEDVWQVMVEYMPFAWDKANGCRGISAERSLAHYKAWLWLIEEDWDDRLSDYEFYGKDQLVEICKFLSLDPNQWDDGVRVNSELELP